MGAQAAKELEEARSEMKVVMDKYTGQLGEASREIESLKEHNAHTSSALEMARKQLKSAEEESAAQLLEVQKLKDDRDMLSKQLEASQHRRRSYLTASQQNLQDLFKQLDEAEGSWTPHSHIRAVKLSIGSLQKEVMDDDVKFG